MQRKRKHTAARAIQRERTARNSIDLSASERELLAISKADWASAKAQERIAKIALRGSIEDAAKRAHRSTRTIRRLIKRYRVNPTLLAFLPRKRGQGFRADDRQHANAAATYTPKLLFGTLKIDRLYSYHWIENLRARTRRLTTAQKGETAAPRHR
jgi:hypothetical protein